MKWKTIYSTCQSLFKCYANIKLIFLFKRKKGTKNHEILSFIRVAIGHNKFKNGIVFAEVVDTFEIRISRPNFMGFTHD